MSEILDFSHLLADTYSCEDSWSNCQTVKYDDFLAMNTTPDYADLDELLDIGDASDIIRNAQRLRSSYEEEYTDVLEFYSGQQFDRIEQEKEKLAKENEAGLLEALQQSMDNIECDPMSEFVSFSSSFSQPVLTSNPFQPVVVNSSSSSMSTSANCTLYEPDEDSDDSVLKQLLLNPSNGNYPREIDANTSAFAEPFGEQTSKSFASDLSPKKQPKAKMPKQLSKKPFTELLKHMDSPASSASKTKPSTTFLNAKSYMRHYGSAPSSRISSPVSEKQSKKVAVKVVTAQPRLVVNKVSVPTIVANTKKPLQTKPNSTTVMPATTMKSSKVADHMIVASDMNSLLDMLEGEPSGNWPSNQKGAESDDKFFRPTPNKRRSVMLIDPLPKKKNRPNMDNIKRSNTPTSSSTTVTECIEQPFAEHDYCQPTEVKTSKASTNVLAAAIEASGITKPEPSEQDDQKSASKASAPINKVIKWEEYLQQLRSGTRSAPNSPTSSPKMTRGSARQVKNFMASRNSIVIQKPTPPPQPTPLIEPVIAAKNPKKKPTIKLLEFEQYLAKLQGKEKETSAEIPHDFTTTPSPISTTSVTVNQANIDDNHATLKKTSVTLSAGSSSHSTHKYSRQAKAVNVISNTSQPFIRISSGGKIHTAAVTSVRTIPASTTPVVMLKIPNHESISTSNAMQMPNLTVRQPFAPSVVTAIPTCLISPKAQSFLAQNGASSTAKASSNHLKDPRMFGKLNEKSQPAVLKPISRANWVPAPKQTVKATNTSVNGNSTTTATSSAPTFKLITSNKGGVETKSVILSGVTGQLKEILTLLAEQQQATDGQGHVDQQQQQQQQKTLQQLLDAITNMKAKNKANNPANTIPNASVAPTTLSENKVQSQSAGGRAPTLANAKNPTSVKKNVSVPSPLSLIHEIKQNMNKKTELTKKQQPPPQTKQQPRFIYTVPATTPSVRARSNSLITPGGGVLSLPGDKDQTTTSAKPPNITRSQSCGTPSITASHSSTIHELHSTSPTVSENLSQVVSTSERKLQQVNQPQSNNQITVFVDAEPEKNQKHAKVGGNKLNLSGKKSADCEVPQEVLKSEVPEKSTVAAETETKKECVTFNTSSTANDNDSLNFKKSPTSENGIIETVFKNDVAITVSNICDQVSKTCGKERLDKLEYSCLNSVFTKPKEYVQVLSPKDCKSESSQHLHATGEVQSVQSIKSNKISVCRSMAAAEMLAAEVLENGQQEVMVYESEKDDILEKPSDVVEIDIAAEEGEISDIDIETQYYNKLPAYFYSGKILNSDSNNVAPAAYKSSANDIQVKHGLKELSSDPLIGMDGNHSDREDNVHYNKLPHYLSSGKLSARPQEFVHGESGEVMLHSNSTHQQKRGLKFSTKPQCTPGGAVIDPNETYYSRLPSYYSYGRTHIVDTVTEPPDEPDDTVTQETLKQDEDRSQSKRKKKKKQKKKKKKQKKKVDKRLDGDRILYSKLPSYLLSGRLPLVPDRAASEESYSCSLSPSSESDEESPIAFRRAYKRAYSPKRSRSPTVSSSRSRSRSVSPRRSWANERRGYNDDVSPNCRYSDDYSSDSDYTSAIRAKRRRRYSHSSGSDREHNNRKRKDDEKSRAIEQRRVMYVGRITSTTTKTELKRRFQKFGQIDDISLYFRKDKDSYAFITFRYKCDTLAAIEHGNEGQVQPQYVLCFGGRRQFCQVEYTDLDEECEIDKGANDNDDLDFDTLLKQAMRR
ncbi:unnamed protein product [Clavelina lepadiformis]|uniref:RRM domain-containing protein n=2 Tax=Clavelina lepadiformis TaxID=159417 RepID=A0ABP0F8A6_CLALP